MKKWRNLRDTFKREVEIERKIREGRKIKKKVYVYYSHMSFLLPHIQSGDSEPEERELPPLATSPRGKKTKFKHRPGAIKRKSFDVPVSNTSVYLEEIDEDKHFLMSLIPSFKKMTEDEKLSAKVDILKVIKGVRSCSSTSTFNYQVIDSLAYNTELEDIRDESDDIKSAIFTEADVVDLASQVNSDQED